MPLTVETVFAAEKRQVFKIDFDGGTAREFVAELDELEINVIVPDSAQIISIPAIKLRNVTADGLCKITGVIHRKVRRMTPVILHWPHLC